ncbi:MAG: hypothetical protein NTX07_02325 [Solirubrobacterales bacterium]|nr:hypothetical protein [Solirubrobacterales bacterium]
MSQPSPYGRLKKISVAAFLACGVALLTPTLSLGATTTPVDGLVATGDGHSCSLGLDGLVLCWGRNTLGQLGDATYKAHNSALPVSDSNGSGYVKAQSVAAGADHTCVVGQIGGWVGCWGLNMSLQLGDGTTTTRTRLVDVIGVSGATAVTAGKAHSCAIVKAGAVKCWGSNTIGQLGDGTILLRKKVVTVSGVTGATAIAAGDAHTCAIVALGAVKCWGGDVYGQLGDGTATLRRMTPVKVSGLTGATAIDAGSVHTCAVVAAGAVKCWGANGLGQIGNGGFPLVNRLPVAVTGLSGATKVSAGYGHTCALVSGGAVKCWGGNVSGPLGDGTTVTKKTPVSVLGVTGAKSISAGYARWGANYAGQLGDGTFTLRKTPVVVGGIYPAY